MSADRYTAAHVRDDQIHILVCPAVFPCIAPACRLLIQRMENRHAPEKRMAGHARHVVQLVDDDRVCDECPRSGNTRCDIGRDQPAQIRGMLALRSMAQVAPQRVVYLVDSRLDRLDQASPADHGRERSELDALLPQSLQNQIAPKAELVRNARIRLQLVGRVPYRAGHALAQIVVNRHFGRRSPRIDDQYDILPIHCFFLQVINRRTKRPARSNRASTRASRRARSIRTGTAFLRPYRPTGHRTAWSPP